MSKKLSIFILLLLILVYILIKTGAFRTLQEVNKLRNEQPTISDLIDRVK